MLWMKLLALVQHVDELSNLLGTRLGLLYVLDPEQNRVPVLAIQVAKNCLAFGLASKACCRSSGTVDVPAGE